MNATELKLRQLQRNVNLLGLVVVLIVTTILGGILLTPLQKQCRTTKQQIASNSETLAQRDAVDVRCAQLEDQIKHTSREIEKLTSRIPMSVQEAEFLNQLAQAAAIAEVQLFGFQPLETRATNKRRRTQVQLNANGTFAGACRLLFEIRRLDRLCEIDHCHLLAGQNDEGRHTMTLTVSIFHTQPDQVALREEAVR